MTPNTPERSLHVVLLHPQIPWNTGNAGRTCLAAGARLHLVRPLGFSLADRYLKRAGLDYWPRVEPRVWSDWEALEGALPTLGEPYFFSGDAPRTLWEVAFPSRTVLIFGSETTGLPDDLRRRFAHRLVALPMADTSLRSLNLSTTVGIAVYEVLRQWRRSPE